MFLLPQGYIDFGGQHTTPNVLLNVYPTIYLKATTLYKSGTGEIESPYIIK